MDKILVLNVKVPSGSTRITPRGGTARMVRLQVCLETHSQSGLCGTPQAISSVETIATDPAKILEFVGRSKQ